MELETSFLDPNITILWYLDLVLVLIQIRIGMGYGDDIKSTWEAIIF